MRIIAAVFAAIAAIGAPTADTPPSSDIGFSDAPKYPDVEYVIDVECSKLDRNHQWVADVWVTSHIGRNGITCAFVDIDVNVPVVDFIVGPDFTQFAGGTIDRFGVADLGGCSLRNHGVGRFPRWSLVATLKFDAQAFPTIITLSDASGRGLGTSLWGYGFAQTIDFGPDGICQNRLPGDSKPDGHNPRRN